MSKASKKRRHRRRLLQRLEATLTERALDCDRMGGDFNMLIVPRWFPDHARERVAAAVIRDRFSGQAKQHVA